MTGLTIEYHRQGCEPCIRPCTGRTRSWPRESHVCVGASACSRATGGAHGHATCTLHSSTAAQLPFISVSGVDIRAREASTPGLGRVLPCSCIAENAIVCCSYQGQAVDELGAGTRDQFWLRLGRRPWGVIDTTVHGVGTKVMWCNG